MLEKEIRKEGRLGCEQLTRPEEIQALTKYLKKRREDFDDTVSLDKDVLGVRDLEGPKKLNDKLEVLDKTKEINLNMTKDGLIVKDTTLDNKKETLSGLKNSNLDERISKINTEDDPRLDKEIEKIDPRKHIDLDNKKIKISPEDPRKLDKSKETINFKKTIDLDSSKEKLEVKDIRLDKSVEELKVKKTIDLDSSKEKLEVKDTRLDKSIEEIKPKKIIDLDSSKEKLEVKDTRLDKSVEELKVKSQVELDSSIERIGEVVDKKLDDTRENINDKRDTILNNSLESIEKVPREKLDFSRETIKTTSLETLDSTRENINAHDNPKLSDDLEKLPKESELSLREDLEKLNDLKKVSLSEELGKIKVQDDQELDMSRSDISSIKEVGLDQDRNNINPVEEPDLNDSLTRSITSLDQELNQTIEEVRGGTLDHNLNDSRLNLNINDISNLNSSSSDINPLPTEDLDSFLSKLGIIEDDELDDSKTILVVEDDNNLNQNRENLGEIKEINLRDDLSTIKVENIELSENLETLEIPESELRDDISTISPIDLPGLYDTVLGLDVQDEGELDNSIQRISPEELEKIENSLLKIDPSDNSELDDRLSKLNSWELTALNNSLSGITPELEIDIAEALRDEDRLNGLMHFADKKLGGWGAKIKTLMSLYLTGDVTPEKASKFQDALFNLIKVERELEGPSGEIKDPKLQDTGAYSVRDKYKLCKRNWDNTLNMSSYLRWIAENTTGNLFGKGPSTYVAATAKESAMFTTLTLLVYGRRKLEKLLKTEQWRLRGTGNELLGSFLSSGVSGLTNSAKKVVNNLFSNSPSDVKKSNKALQAPKKETTGWEYGNLRPNTSEGDTRVGISKNKSSYKNTILNAVKDKIISAADAVYNLNKHNNTYSFKDNYLKGIGIETTLQDLTGLSTSEISSVEDLATLLNNDDSIITTASKFTSDKSQYRVYTLDGNNNWEITLEPLLFSGNGYTSFLPSLEEINLRNKELHGVNTGYNRWIPFTSFDLSKSRLNSKTLPLYHGEISYPESLEFTNELRVNIADDQYKSWRTYFESCIDCTVYHSKPHDANYYERVFVPGSTVEISKPLRGVFMPKLYKQVCFKCNIYTLTPQLSTISKYSLIVVLKDFIEERSGDIDGGGSDLNVVFSIVGENPDIYESGGKGLDEDGTGGDK